MRTLFFLYSSINSATFHLFVQSLSGAFYQCYKNGQIVIFTTAVPLLRLRKNLLCQATRRKILLRCSFFALLRRLLFALLRPLLFALLRRSFSALRYPLLFALLRRSFSALLRRLLFALLRRSFSALLRRPFSALRYHMSKNFLQPLSLIVILVCLRNSVRYHNDNISQSQRR